MRARGCKPGYTLLEVLIVIAIVSLMVSLLVPAVAVSRNAARRVQCANNLHNIGLGYAQRKVSRSNAPFTPGNWQSRLASILKDDTAFVCPIATAQAVSTNLVCRVTHGGWPVQSIPFEAGPRCLKKNETANSYELWFEDWNNWDFRDLRVLVTHQSGSGDKITVIQVDSSSTFDIQTDDGTPLLATVTKHNWPGRSCVTPTGEASYGINNRFKEFSGKDGRKILILDYSKSIANVVGPDATDHFSAQVAPRHDGHCNVLFEDGGVSSFDPAEIDPADLRIHDTLWKPEHDPPLLSPKSKH